MEELDIADLNRLSAATSAADVKTMYANRSKGSRNHLRSFISQLTSRGGTFESEHISREQFNSIVNSPRERGPYVE